MLVQAELSGQGKPRHSSISLKNFSKRIKKVSEVATHESNFYQLFQNLCKKVKKQKKIKIQLEISLCENQVHKQNMFFFRTAL